MKHITCLCLVGLTVAACQPNNEFTISGTLPEPFTGKVYLTCIKDKLTHIDSLSLNEATTFEFKGSIEQPDMYRIMASPRSFDASLIVEPQSHYQVTVQDPHNNLVEVIEGGSNQKLLDEYQNSLAPFQEKDEQLNEAFRQIDREKEPAKLDSIQTLMSNNFQAREDATRMFIKQHAHSFTAVQLAGDLLLYTYPDLKEIYDQIDTVAYSNRYSFRRFKEKLEEARYHWLQGQPAPDFTTHDLNGKEVKLSDFKGQYVLLDFWASWCAPCRKRAHELKGIYDQLQARGITICGLSMDDKREQWMAATQEDGIIWTNTSDLKPFKENSIATAYRVTALPTLFLVGPDGNIALQNPSTEELLNLPVK